MISIRPRDTLDGAELDWLSARHHFRVNAAGNPAHGPIGSLVVWNEDDIAAGRGFPLHSHADMEIITYVREGVVLHRDSLGNQGATMAGDVQVMSAGTGIRHEERSYAEGRTRLFQIWILPRRSGDMPRWGNKPFPKADRAGRWIPLASGLDDAEALPIGADARVLGAMVSAGQTLAYRLEQGHKAYLVSAAGRVRVNGQRLEEGDGAAIEAETELLVEADEQADIILVDVA
jgi:redox-sensitive bicupin YhaK (pirin superfamily)